MAKANIKVFGVVYRDPKRRKNLRAVVATTSLTSAARLIGISRSEMESYGGETHNKVEVEQGMRHPGEAFAMNDGKVLYSIYNKVIKKADTATRAAIRDEVKELKQIVAEAGRAEWLLTDEGSVVLRRCFEDAGLKLGEDKFLAAMLALEKTGYWVYHEDSLDGG